MRVLRLLKPAVLAGTLGLGCYTPPPEAPGSGDDGREATAAELEGCTYIGGLNRYGVRGEAGGMCATLVLVDAPGAQRDAAPALSLPPELGVEAFSLVQGPCEGRAWRSPHEPGRAPAGSVTFRSEEWELEVDVRFPTGLGTPERVRLHGTVVATDGPSCL